MLFNTQFVKFWNLEFRFLGQLHLKVYGIEGEGVQDVDRNILAESFFVSVFWEVEGLCSSFLTTSDADKACARAVVGGS